MRRATNTETFVSAVTGGLQSVISETGEHAAGLKLQTFTWVGKHGQPLGKP